MDHGWAMWQWVVYTIPNVIIFFAYVYIPYKLGNASNVYKLTAKHNIELFRWFIFCCAVHHLLMPPLMYFDFFTALVVIDTITAVISVQAAINLDFTKR